MCSIFKREFALLNRPILRSGNPWTSVTYLKYAPSSPEPRASSGTIHLRRGLS